jgi:hypothetical protein
MSKKTSADTEICANAFMREVLSLLAPVKLFTDRSRNYNSSEIQNVWLPARFARLACMTLIIVSAVPAAVASAAAAPTP